MTFDILFKLFYQMYAYLVFYNCLLILGAAHGTSLGYGLYGAAENDANSNRKLHNIKTHQQMSNTGQLDNTRPLEEMPYQVMLCNTLF